MKKKITALCVAILLICMTVTGTVSYYSNNFITHNVLTTGHVKLELVEEFPKEGVKGVLPGQTVSKIVKVKNTGSVPAWVRVQVGITIKDRNGTLLSNILSNGSHAVEGTVLEQWIHGETGMYYYNGILTPGETTKDLMRSVYFDIATGNEYQGGVVHMDITAYGVQSEHNGTNVQEAQGWPL